MGSDEETSTGSSCEAQNSATEISTDSEFEHDGVTAVRDPPSILVDNSFVTNIRSSRFRDYQPTKVHVKSSVIEKPVNGNLKFVKQNCESKAKPYSNRFLKDYSKESAGVELNIQPIIKADSKLVKKFETPKEHAIAPLVNPRPGDYLLKHTQSTSGIASKKSLELKKQYLLGGDGTTGTIQKSGSASALDTRFKTFHNNISECQKLLNTSAPEKSPTMQTFLQHGSSTLKESGPLSPLRAISSMQGYFHAIPTLSIIEKPNSKISVPETGIYKSTDNIPTPSSAKPDIIDLTISPIGVTNKNHVRNLSKPDVIDLNISPDVIDLTISPMSIEKPIQDESTQKQDSYLETKPDTNEEAQQSDSDFRARSPAHETSIVVPDVTWLSVKQSDGKSVSDDLSSDSLSSSNSSSDEESESNLNRYNELISRSPSPEKSNPINFVPQIEVTGTSGELMQMDSLMIIDGKYIGDPEDLVNIQSLPDIPSVTNVNIQNSKLESASESGNELATVLTETELSDWAVDDAVSDNFVDVEFNIDPEYGNLRKQKKPKACKKSKPKVDLHLHARIAKGEDFDDMVHVCGKAKSAMTNILQNMDIENIEFMDTGSEDSCIGNVAVASNSVLVNRGYVEFVDNDLTPVVPKRDSFIDNTELPSREIVEVTNRDFRDVDYVEQGACILNNDIKSTIGHVTISQEVNLESLNPDSLTNCVVPVEKDIVHNSSCEQEEDSLFILESADTTTSDALTVVTSPLETLSKCNMDQCLSLSEDKGKSSSTSEKQEQTMRPKSPVKQKDMKHSIKKHSLSNEKLNTTVKQLNPNDQQVYDQYVKKLEEKMAGFGNVRDSIDVRKSRRRSKGNLMKPTGVIESDENGTNPKSLSLVNDLIHYSSTTDHNMSSLDTSRKLEEISRERVKQKDIIHDMVIDKLTTKKMLNAEKRLNRSRSRSSFSPGSAVVKPNFNKSTVEKLESQLSNNKLTPHSIVLKPQQSTTNNINTNVADSKTNKSKELLKCISPSLDINKSDRENISPQADIAHGLHYMQSVNFEADSLVVENQRSTPLTSFKKLSQRKLLRPLSVHSSFNASPALTSPLSNSHCTNPEALSLPDIHRKLQEDLFKTPSAPPQSKQEETKHMVDCLKQNARERVRLKSDEELGLSPEDKFKLLRQKSANKKYAFEANKCEIKSMIVNESFESMGNSNSVTAQAPTDTDFQKRPARTKSVNDLAHCSVNYNPEMSTHKAHLITTGSPEQIIKATFTSDPNLLSGSTNKSDKKVKPKDRERRKSIIQAVSDFFLKRKESMSMPTSPTGKYSRFSKFRISPKYKERTKEKDPETLANRCRSESTLTIDGHAFEEQAPPIPPPPVNYRPCPVHRLSYSAYDSQSEDLDLHDGTSLEMLDMADSSLALNSFHSGEHSAEPRRGRSKKTGKHAQLKRFQKAQQIQRQLEEIEVKQRQLEANGVCIEKALRGEGGASVRHCQSDEQLFASWVSLRKEQKDLHIFEEDLRIHAKELQLVDRHEHLQHELKERLAGDDELKTCADLAREGAILQEMLDIVAEHDSLVLQRDRLRNMDLAGSPIYSDGKINTSYMNSLPKLDQ